MPAHLFLSSEMLQEQVHAAVGVLRSGGVVAIPTDTLYGLAACALDERAVRRIFQVKGRPEGMALPLLVADVGDMDRYAMDVPEIARALAERFWPGALTLVLKKAPFIPDVVTGGKPTVGLRVPDHWVPRAIVRELGAPITGTSANLSGMPGLTTAQAVREQLGGQVDLVVDGGEAPGGVPSTVLDVTATPPRVLRQGAVSAAEIEAVCQTLLAHTRDVP